MFSCFRSISLSQSPPNSFIRYQFFRFPACFLGAMAQWGILEESWNFVAKRIECCSAEVYSREWCGVAQDRITRLEKMLELQKRMERRTRNNKEEGRVWDILYTMTQFILIKKTSEVRVGPALTKGYFVCCNMVIEVCILCFQK